MMRWIFAVLALTQIELALAAPSLPLYGGGFMRSTTSNRRNLRVRRQLVEQLEERADAQTSLTLDPSQIQNASSIDGLAGAANGTVASATSNNNFINFCLTQTGVAITNGTQNRNGSCNPTPMGRILGFDVMPSTKFLSPVNLGTIAANKTFTVKLTVANLQTGHFTNPDTTYFAAPAQVNTKGHLVGHTHIVIQQVPSLNSTAIPDPRKFAFFQGVNGKATADVLNATVTGGLPAGVYRMGSITTASNHQPALVAVAQHGMLDDTIYFTVS
ncbi:hypothetical protein M422DRAFT_244392 [Sphaerobolus stellatus SS14]|nr:hypothetical protein M422DRAFT_244392 [Sphaerobolus stellatus SS14]